MEEIWKDIIRYEGLYQISNYGRVRGLEREWECGNRGTRRKREEAIFSGTINNFGYLSFMFRKDGVSKSFRAHILVWEHFGNSPRNNRILQVDHIDENKLNNRIDNLQLLDNRQNCTKGFRKHKITNYPVGVYKDKRDGRYQSEIQIDGKRHYLGRFACPLLASIAYQNRLLTLTNYKM